LKEEALDRPMWRARFGRGFGPVVRQTTKWMNEWMFVYSLLQYRSFTQSILFLSVYHITNSFTKKTDSNKRKSIIWWHKMECCNQFQTYVTHGPILEVTYLDILYNFQIFMFIYCRLTFVKVLALRYTAKEL